ncbi:hypothetical protein BHE74_00039406 [Ensete ventricosum]|nr:hypothetical protein BHE74_00039406 [Ensete ventricosum]
MNVNCQGSEPKIEDGGGPTMCWQRPHMEKLSEFITRESVCNGDVIRRRHGAADHGGIVRGNATQAIMSHEGHDHAEVWSRDIGSSTLV